MDLQLFAGEKTEEPTAKRRSDARKKGQIGRSQPATGSRIMGVVQCNHAVGLSGGISKPKQGWHSATRPDRYIVRAIGR